SENCIIEENKDEKEIEKRKSLEKILEKTREVLKESELNQIRNAIWGKKKNKKPKIPLEPRFNCLLTSISSLLPDGINEEFVKKIVNTRNNITHPKEQKLPAFSAVEYDNASYLLTKVIRAYLLNTLSFNSEIIKKIITF
ncbi:HEPN domain-containing protein, partial [Parabacteroides sp.]|uniref:HEPN domain-containing protein n=1 Tax=Parabacteroides sp. TaxID=1869337 RepID=UPI00284BFD2B